MKHKLAWHTASPLWDPSLDEEPNSVRFHEPVILRFAGDNFMEKLTQILTDNPSELAKYVARQETWREERVGWLDKTALAAEKSLKLYQAVHNRFYLVAANLVCRIPGMPDQRIDPAGERVSFVIRRLEPKDKIVPINPKNPNTYIEYGWIGDRQAGHWLQVSNVATLDPKEGDEERLALFPLSFEQEGIKRRLHAGLIPVATREVYESGAHATTAEAFYVIRCVYEQPRCGKLDVPIVSQASRPFQLASFFDPDAPVRQVRIQMPVDTSVEGLRKFPKAVSILLSKQLRQQMERVQNASLKNIDEGKVGEGRHFDLGMICSLSIPIITISAMMLLMIIVKLLNIVFWWLPFFKRCLPIPKEK